MTTTPTSPLELISQQLAELEDLRANQSMLERWQAELQDRESAVAAAAEQPWESLAVVRAEALGADHRTQQVLALIEQQLCWLRPQSPAATVLRTLRKQILQL